MSSTKTSVIGLSLAISASCVFPAYPQTPPDSVTAPEIQLTAELGKTEIPLNRTAQLIVTLKWSGDLDRYEVAELEEPIVRNLKIVGTGSSNRVYEEQGVPLAVKKYTYELQPQELGMGYVEGMAVLYTDTVTGKSHRLLTQRLQLKVVDPLPEPGQRASWYYYIIGVFLIIVIAAGYVGWRRRGAAPEIPAIQEVSLEERILGELRGAIDTKDPTLSLKEGYADLSKVARRYLGQKYGLAGLERTTDELLAELQRTSVDERLVSEAEEVLQQCDRVKFGGEPGEREEFERFFGIVEKWLTRPGSSGIQSQ